MYGKSSKPSRRGTRLRATTRSGCPLPLPDPHRGPPREASFLFPAGSRSARPGFFSPPTVTYYLLLFTSLTPPAPDPASCRTRRRARAKHGVEALLQQQQTRDYQKRRVFPPKQRVPQDQHQDLGGIPPAWW